MEALAAGSAWEWRLFLLYGGWWTVGMAVFWVAFRAVRHRRAARDHVEGRAVVERALRTGRLPEGVAPAAWRRAMTEEITSNREGRWAAVGLGLCIVVLVAVAAVIDSDPAVGLLALLLVAATVAVDRWCARRVRQAEDLLTALDAP
jgi:hypothetical protein